MCYYHLLLIIFGASLFDFKTPVLSASNPSTVPVRSPCRPGTVIEKTTLACEQKCTCTHRTAVIALNVRQCTATVNELFMIFPNKG